MTSINDKLGLPRAGKRSMMKLPSNRADAVKVTSARCPNPKCGRTGARVSKTRPGFLYFPCCNEYAEVPV